MNRRNFLLSLLLLALWALPVLAQGPDCPRVVAFADVHYGRGGPHGAAARVAAVDEVNTWPDVSLVAVLGDIVDRTGSPEEYALAAEFVARIKKPKAPVAGNHEFMYADAPAGAKSTWAEPAVRREKLGRFQSVFGVEGLAYTRELGGYLLVFLSPDEADGRHLTELSPARLSWLRETLRANAAKPTLIFFHAPLKGTLESYSPKVNTAQRIAQPEAAIRAILLANPQVKAWVSGHTHTRPGNESFVSPVNLYEGGVVNIHTPDMTGNTIWSNSLYLCPDRIVARTWNHSAHSFEDGLDRVIPIR
jgi:3',5'-cyclic AMP phosphodiesterase CpdA